MGDIEEYIGPYKIQQWPKFGHGNFKDMLYTDVYKAVHIDTAQLVAVKRINPKDEIYVETLQSEINLMKKVRHHANILTIRNDYELSPNTGTEFWIVTDLCELGNYDTYAVNYSLSDAHKVRIMRDVSSGLAHLQDVPVLHSNIKPENVLFTLGLGGRHVVRLGDYGANRENDNRLHMYPYSAPELYDKTYWYSVERSLAQDRFSAGLMFYQTIKATTGIKYSPVTCAFPSIGFSLWSGRHKRDNAITIDDSEPDFSKRVLLIIHNLLHLLPEMRKSMREVEEEFTQILDSLPEQPGTPQLRSDLLVPPRPSPASVDEAHDFHGTGARPRTAMHVRTEVAGTSLSDHRDMPIGNERYTSSSDSHVNEESINQYEEAGNQCVKISKSVAQKRDTCVSQPSSQGPAISTTASPMRQLTRPNVGGMGAQPKISTTASSIRQPTRPNVGGIRAQPKTTIKVKKDEVKSHQSTHMAVAQERDIGASEPPSPQCTPPTIITSAPHIRRVASHSVALSAATDNHHKPIDLHTFQSSMTMSSEFVLLWDYISNTMVKLRLDSEQAPECAESVLQRMKNATTITSSKTPYRQVWGHNTPPEGVKYYSATCLLSDGRIAMRHVKDDTTFVLSADLELSHQLTGDYGRLCGVVNDMLLYCKKSQGGDTAVELSLYNVDDHYHMATLPVTVSSLRVSSCTHPTSGYFAIVDRHDQTMDIYSSPTQHMGRADKLGYLLWSPNTLMFHNTVAAVSDMIAVCGLFDLHLYNWEGRQLRTISRSEMRLDGEILGVAPAQPHNWLQVVGGDFILAKSSSVIIKALHVYKLK